MSRHSGGWSRVGASTVCGMLGLLVACGDGSGSGVGFETGALMRPGQDCEFCHREGSDYPNAPHWSLAGTVYASKNAAVDEGVEGAEVVISNAAGAEAFRLTTNAVGNFYTLQTLPDAYRVAVEYQGERIEMPCTPPSGGCAKCHNRPAIGFAPGRIFVPQGQEGEPTPFDCETWMPTETP